ncbi:hypothetical protein [Lentzea albida]|uniref:hypothetical protein n=1 Tax=Lentzea albida TaxID=65499 RepID=UPI000B7FDEA7|nr:hypothetical protein [Lentzea albida]
MDGREVTTPTAFGMFPKEMTSATRRVFANIVHRGEPARGGPLPAWEQPSIFVDDVRAAGCSAANADRPHATCAATRPYVQHQ